MDFRNLYPKTYRLPLITLYFLSFLFICWGELDDEDMYPIIINTDDDRAVFILPDAGCHILTDTRLIRKAVNRKKNEHLYKADGETMDEIIGLCEHYQSDRINASQFVIGLQQKGFLIYPGTHFCGAGNNAENDTDLGYYVETDKCCREHDFCKNFIRGWTCHPEIPDLCNITPFTRSHCSCDQRFRECLQKANDTASLHIGILYFTVFGLKCFKKDYPITKCQQYGGFLNIHCQKYNLDIESEMMYQFFDSPIYSRGKIMPVNLTSAESPNLGSLLDSNDTIITCNEIL